MFQFLIPAAATLLGAKMATDATKSAAKQATDVQERMFERQVELQEPWRQAGVNALARLQELAPYQQFGEGQFRADPGYAFRLSEGMKALERSRAAGGNLLSGGTLRAGQRYAQDLASQEYGNAFNRYQIERQAALGPYQSLAGVGQTAANTLTGAAGQFGQDQASIAGNAALMRGSTYGNALNQLGYLTGRYYGQQPSAGYPSGYSATNPYYDQPGAGWAGGGP